VRVVVFCVEIFVPGEAACRPCPLDHRGQGGLFTDPRGYPDHRVPIQFISHRWHPHASQLENELVFTTLHATP
jgi:hypothetical protein